MGGWRTLDRGALTFPDLVLRQPQDEVLRLPIAFLVSFSNLDGGDVQVHDL
jgi:hypothetical protein